MAQTGNHRKRHSWALTNTINREILLSTYILLIYPVILTLCHKPWYIRISVWIHLHVHVTMWFSPSKNSVQIPPKRCGWTIQTCWSFLSCQLWRKHINGLMPCRFCSGRRVLPLSVWYVEVWQSQRVWRWWWMTSKRTWGGWMEIKLGYRHILQHILHAI